MERKLGGFAETPTEQPQTHRRHRPKWGPRVRAARQIGKANGSEKRPGPEDSKDKAKVPDPVDEEGLVGGSSGRGPFMPEPNQQIGAEADQFPEDEHRDEVVGENDSQHREDK